MQARGGSWEKVGSWGGGFHPFLRVVILMFFFLNLDGKNNVLYYGRMGELIYMRFVFVWRYFFKADYSKT